ncbi:hypothetical protein FIBSPDRAFT_875192 [Athelia psychrophila]|uniref:Uncharacterized protein n=1 Tax=Athelia psychrophila TaxID=1759441 RepID=A0A165WMX4_9AGAM|nr:hypothetical protein FIBSPDRAFT_875192 [Fibularhizoctonia sp. CBS 109695]
MQRPGPLQELPLEHFLPPNPNLPRSPYKLGKGSKRPLSPGAPSTYSPAKRRILAVEGILSPESLKSPLSAAALYPTRFGDLARGPDSPARKLNFGLPKNHTESSPGSSTVVHSTPSSHTNATPTRTKSKSLAPSPVLLSKSTASALPALPSDGSEMDDYFSTPQPPRYNTRSSTSNTLPMMIPRELPPPPDRQSMHYPGFDVLPDTHIPLLRARSVSVEPLDMGSEPKRDKECCKENVAPRRRAKKAVTAPEAAELTRSGLLSPLGKQKEAERTGKAKSTPGTPNKTSTADRMASMTPTPRRKGPAATAVATPQERRQARRMLEDEADEVGGDEDTINAML